MVIVIKKIFNLLFKILFFPILITLSIKHRFSKYYRLTNISRNKLINNKGLYGEYLIFKTLEKMDNDSYILMNLYLPKKDNTTECDIICIRKSGIYVIESKNLDGIIYGDEDLRYWCNSNKSKDFTFYNPIKQNKAHIRQIIDNIILNYDSLYKSIIVFNNNSILNVKDINELENKNTYIIKLKDLKQTIEKIEKKEKKDVLNHYMMKEVYERLLPYIKVNKKIKKKHIKYVKKIKEENLLNNK